MTNEKTLGEICAGIGGFGVGFEQAGWETKWQIELDDVNRAVLADRFPYAKQLKNLLDWRSYRSELSSVGCIAFGFPCQGISVMGNVAGDQSHRGLKDSRSGLFYACMDIVSFVQPAWVVIENVPALLHSNDCEDIQIVVRELAQRGYVGYFRVLNSQYFGIPQKRRRFLLVAGFGRYPSMDFLADAGPVESIPCAPGTQFIAKSGDAFAGYTLTSPNKHDRQRSRFNISSELFVVEENGWSQMLERHRAVEIHGLRRGLDETNIEEAYAAGNSFPPPMAKWIAEILNRS